jgi:hypothetical protein
MAVSDAAIKDAANISPSIIVFIPDGAGAHVDTADPVIVGCWRWLEA